MPRNTKEAQPLPDVPSGKLATPLSVPLFGPIVEDDTFRGDLINLLYMRPVYRKPRPKDEGLKG